MMRFRVSVSGHYELSTHRIGHQDLQNKTCWEIVWEAGTKDSHREVWGILQHSHQLQPKFVEPASRLTAVLELPGFV